MNGQWDCKLVEAGCPRGVQGTRSGSRGAGAENAHGGIRELSQNAWCQWAWQPGEVELELPPVGSGEPLKVLKQGSGMCTLLLGFKASLESFLASRQ